MNLLELRGERADHSTMGGALGHPFARKTAFYYGTMILITFRSQRSRCYGWLHVRVLPKPPRIRPSSRPQSRLRSLADNAILSSRNGFAFRGVSTAINYRDYDIVEEEVGYDEAPTNAPFDFKATQQKSYKPRADFQLRADYSPSGDQPQAISALKKQLDSQRFSMLQGATGTGKTFVMANLIAARQQPVVVLAHNKTLAAQLARELRSFLGAQAVQLFVSYYNHYVPESFSETTNKYVAKKSAISAELDALRHCATRALLTEPTTVLVCSVSCLYGMGLPSEYLDNSWELQVGDDVSIDETMERLDSMLYTTATDTEFSRGQYQEMGSDALWIWPPQNANPILLGWDSTIQQISQIGNDNETTSLHIFPAQHHVVSANRMEEACETIESELKERVAELRANEKTDAAERLSQRVLNDIYLLRETGSCPGIENYSRHLAGRAAGEPPSTVLDYLGGTDWWLIVDESHVSIPQIKAMYYGDRKRKENLVKHGYRLPSALDNRPLQQDEFWSRVPLCLFVSATPAATELDWCNSQVVPMNIRPTFVPDPVVHVRSKEDQLKDLAKSIEAHRPYRTLALVLTKRDAEDLSQYLNKSGIPTGYLHSGLTTHERAGALKKLQHDEIQCLVGVNCLREGLDLPEVSLVAVFDADAKGFLRSDTALLQIIGRAARNVEGTAILYANEVTDAMRRCMDVTSKRRAEQIDYNKIHGCEMRSTKSSSMLSIFDLAQDQIRAELESTQTSDSCTSWTSFEAPPDRKVELLNPEDGIETKHIPSSPGVYFWKDCNGDVLYIGKAVKLRSRVRSYLTSKHPSRRIKVMLEKATRIEFILTPSERDALVLESNLVKHHQPPFNVLLKDDEHYPYLCAKNGDLPELKIVPRRQDGDGDRFFGPYTSFREIYEVMDAIDEKYDLRGKAFLVRHGSLSKQDYLNQFNKVLDEVFSISTERLSKLRTCYEQAGLLFDADHNRCRDVVVAVPIEESRKRTKISLVVHVAQLRDGLVASQFSYTCWLPGTLEDLTNEDFGDAIESVLVNQHYASGKDETSEFRWFPEAILSSYKIPRLHDLKRMFGGSKKVSVRTAARSGQNKAIDARVLEFAVENAIHVAKEKAFPSVKELVDGTAASEVAQMLGLSAPPSRIECYDVSHIQGEYSSASRVVFIDGRPCPRLYRNFNVKTVNGVDDYASLREVLHRRFRRLNEDDQDESWSRPDLVVIDGGKGQLGAAIEAFDNSNLKIPICSVAKREEEVFAPHSKNPVNRDLDASSPGMLLLRAIRDESHRVALRLHRSRRSILKSGG